MKLTRLPLNASDGPFCWIDGERARWHVAYTDSAIELSDGGDAEPGVEQAVEPDRNESCEPAIRHLWLYTNTTCNLACRHCLLPEHATEPPLSDVLARLEEGLASGVDTVFLTGGEPFVRSGIETVVAAAASRARTIVLSNGTLLDDRLLSRLDGLGAAKWKRNLHFQISVEGEPQANDRIRGRGSFDRALRGIQALIAWGRPPSISTALTRHNIDSASRVTALAASLGLGTHHLFLPHETGRMKASPPPLELLEAVRSCRSVGELFDVVIDNDAALAARVRSPGRRFISCRGGHDMLAIGAEGRVYPCPSLVGHEATGCGSIPLQKAKDCDSVEAFRRNDVERREECSRCELRFFCGGGCAAYSYWSGGYDAREPYCEVYKGLIEDALAREAKALFNRSPSLAPGDVLSPEALPAKRARFDCA